MIKGQQNDRKGGAGLDLNVKLLQQFNLVKIRPFNRVCEFAEQVGWAEVSLDTEHVFGR